MIRPAKDPEVPEDAVRGVLDETPGLRVAAGEVLEVGRGLRVEAGGLRTVEDDGGGLRAVEDDGVWRDGGRLAAGGRVGAVVASAVASAEPESGGTPASAAATDASAVLLGVALPLVRNAAARQTTRPTASRVSGMPTARRRFFGSCAPPCFVVLIYPSVRLIESPSTSQLPPEAKRLPPVEELM
ncbi:hypothetical protein GCM10022235_78630 [Kribbella ginsengisoli]|uniref:Uncharacterized protein n=1 Tax=Kribbella ginsengisoli TaxID=363865 RepID=A0ABP6Z0I1_9ACTN